MRIWTLLLVFSQLAVASPMPIYQSHSAKKNTYLKDGVFIGGKAGGGTSLLGVRRVYSAKAQIERVILDLGDQDAKPAGKDLGYFQASVDSKQNRIILDLAQLKYSKISEPQIKALFKKSPYVASSEFVIDPQDKSGKLVLQLNQPMRLEVFELTGGKKPGRVVLDLTPAKKMQIKGTL